MAILSAGSRKSADRDLCISARPAQAGSGLCLITHPHQPRRSLAWKTCFLAVFSNVDSFIFGKWKVETFKQAFGRVIISSNTLCINYAVIFG